jgi:hypothetical protein
MTYVKAVVVQDAQFNVRVDPSEFAVAVPAATTVVDVSDSDPAVRRVAEPVHDLETVLGGVAGGDAATVR